MIVISDLSTEFLRNIASYTNVSQSETGNITHNIHPYAAKFIPQIPAKIIEEFSNERHTVLDPFCGSGTTLVEAKVRGRKSIGFDLNPVAALVSKVKTQSLSAKDLQVASRIMSEIKENVALKKTSDIWVPEIPNIDHWFSSEAQIGLGRIAFSLSEISNSKVKDFLSVCFSSIIVQVSNQEGETRFVAKHKDILRSDVFNIFQRKFNQMKDKYEILSNNFDFNQKSKVFFEDSRNLSKKIKKDSIDLVITSPPYLNSYDYYLYHKFRIYWLGFRNDFADVKEVQNKEIGARFHFSGPNAKEVSVFKDDMTKCFLELKKVVKPGKLVFFLVGDSIVKGQFIGMDEFYRDIANNAGFKMVSKVSYPMKDISRSFISQNARNPHFSKKMQHILIFENAKRSSRAEESRSLKITKKVQEIPSDVGHGSKILITSNDVAIGTHGMVKYPAKFIPHIPRWAISNYSKEGDLVLDPFGGCGTTQVEASILGRNSIGLDINPAATLYSSVKTTSISESKLEENFNKILSSYKRIKYNDKLPDIPLLSFWFDKDKLQNFFRLKKVIDSISETKIKNFFYVCLSGIVKQISYLDESQLKVKRSHKKLIEGVRDPLELFSKTFEKNLNCIKYFNKHRNRKCWSKSMIGTASLFSKKLQKQGKADLVVSSPPYINAMNYSMYNRYELLLLGLIEIADHLNHQSKYIGTERVYAKDYKRLEQCLFKEKSHLFLNDYISKVYQGEPKRAFIVKKYFDEMIKSIQNVKNILKPKGKFVLVCGSNTIKGVYIPTHDLLTKLCELEGFRIVKSFEYQIRNHRFKITRHSTGRKISVDKVIVLEN